MSASRAKTATGRRAATVDGAYALAQSRAVLRDLFTHSARIYWTDFILTLLVAYGAVAVYLATPLFSLPCFLGFTIAAFALYRCGVFIHEIAHMPRERMPVFQVTWNILFGVPALMPSFMYKSHGDHHNPRHFGTSRDGEYLPLGAGPARRIIFYLLQVPLLPALGIFRFLVLTPLALLHPRLRKWVWEHASSYVINPGYSRTVPADEPHGAWMALEAAIFVELATLAVLLFSGRLAWTVLIELYVLGMAAAGLNWIRTMAAHGYANAGETMSFEAQLEDSITVSGHPLLTELLFPVGLRYHCLHHMFPALPYHSMGVAHARLLAQQPTDALYLGTVRRGLLDATARLWRSARRPANPTPGGTGTTPVPSTQPRAPGR